MPNRGEREVAITGAGAVTAFGVGVPALWEGLRTNRTGLAPATLFDTRGFQARLVAEVPAVPPDPRGRIRSRAALFALAAAAEALAGAEEAFAGPRSALVVGTTLGGNREYTEWLDARAAGAAAGADGLAESTLGFATRLLSERTEARGPALTVSVACASGSAAVGAGAELIRRGVADRVLAGGYDALSKFVFSGFDALRALSRTIVRPFDRRRDGLGLGEGAGFLLLEERRSADRRGAPVLALVRGYASASDAHHMTRPSPEGSGLSRAIEGALGMAGISPSRIAFVSAHGTGTTFNDRMEAAAFRRLFGERAREVPVNSIKGALGHTLGAAGALEAVMTALVLARGVAPPTAGLEEPDPECRLDVVAQEARPLAPGAAFALSTSSAFAGTNAALVLERA